MGDKFVSVCVLLFEALKPSCNFEISILACGHADVKFVQFLSTRLTIPMHDALVFSRLQHAHPYPYISVCTFARSSKLFQVGWVFETKTSLQVLCGVL